MMPKFELSPEVVAASISFLLAWFSKNSNNDDDDDVLDTHEFTQAALSNADFINKAEEATGHNLRDEMSVEQAEDMEETMGLLRWGHRRN